MGDGLGNLIDTRKAYHVFVRVFGGVLSVFNNKVPPENDLLVMIGRDPVQPKLTQVLSTATFSPGGSTGGAVSGYAPASRYEWMGEDPIFIDKRLILARRISTYFGMQVKMYPDMFSGMEGWIALLETAIDLSSYIPATAGKSALVLITLNTAGEIVLTDGADVDTADLLPANIPAAPEDTSDVLAAIKVYYGQSSVQNADILDLRFTYFGGVDEALIDHDHSGGAGDGGQFPLTNLQSTGAASGQIATADGAGGIGWEDLPDFEVPNAFDYAAGPYEQAIITTDNMDTESTNAFSWRYQAIDSMRLGGKIWQLYAHYNGSYNVVIDVRQVPGPWANYETELHLEAPTDGHRYIAVILDNDGYIHLWWGMHDTPTQVMLYRRSTLPVDQFAGVLTDNLAMLGTNESEVTYPSPTKDPDGNIFFMFRDHVAGNGDTYFYAYNPATQTWAAAAGSGVGGLLLNGKIDGNSAYWYAPAWDENGKMHFFWTWLHSTGGGYIYIGLSYAAWDGANWTQIDGSAQSMTIRSTNDGEVLSYGFQNQPSVLNQAVAVDREGHPHFVHSCIGEDDYMHLYHWWHNGTAWVMAQLTTSAVEVNGVPWSFLVIDRSSNTAYVVAQDDSNPSSLTGALILFTSGPNDFTTWTRCELRPADTNLAGYGPKYDEFAWRNFGRLSIPVEYCAIGDTDQPIYLFEFTPSGWALKNAKDYPDLHANDIDTADGIHHTLGTGANQAAPGDHTHEGLSEPTQKYRQFLYTVIDGNPTFLTDSSGNILTVALDTE